MDSTLVHIGYLLLFICVFSYFSYFASIRSGCGTELDLVSSKPQHCCICHHCNRPAKDFRLLLVCLMFDEVFSLLYSACVTDDITYRFMAAAYKDDTLSSVDWSSLQLPLSFVFLLLTWNFRYDLSLSLLLYFIYGI